MSTGSNQGNLRGIFHIDLFPYIISEQSADVSLTSHNMAGITTEKLQKILLLILSFIVGSSCYGGSFGDKDDLR